MTVDSRTHITDRNHHALIDKPHALNYDALQSMRELVLLISKPAVGTASLENLRTDDLYFRPATKPQETTKPQDATKLQDATKPTDAAKQQDIAAEHQRLSDWADHNLKEPKLSEFKNDMDSFEARAKRDGLDQNEVLKTYKQLERLNDAKGDKPLSEAQRQKLAEQVLHQAAVPTSIDQGNHNTCSAATVEVRTYSRTPSDAARLVTDVALTGAYKAADGTHVSVDPHPHDESKSGTKVDGERTYASEIFQVAAVNIHYAKENSKNNTRLHYEQRTPNRGDDTDTGSAWSIMPALRQPLYQVPPTYRILR